MSLALLGSGVMTAQDIKTNYMPGTDFSKYRTYKWVAINNTEQVDPIVVQQIKDAIDAQLTAKGMTKTDADSADMYVGIQTSIQQQQTMECLRHGRRLAVWRRHGERHEYHDSDRHSRRRFL